MDLEGLVKGLAGVAADNYSRHTVVDIVAVVSSKDPNLEAIGRAIGHIAAARTLLILLDDVSGLPPGVKKLVTSMGESLGEMEARKMIADLKTQKATGTDPIVKNEWKSQL